MNDTETAILDALEESYQGQLDQAHQWETHYHEQRDEKYKAYFQGQTDALASCLCLLNSLKESASPERGSQPFSPSALSRGSADGERHVEFHCKGFEKMSPELCRYRRMGRLW